MDFTDMDDFDTAAVKAPRSTAVVEQQMRCTKCKGRGTVTYGYVNISTYTCGICKGAGVVTQKRLDNIARAKKAADTQAKNRAANEAAARSWLSSVPTIAAFMDKHASRNNFVGSLREQLFARGTLSPKQVEALRNMMAKYAQNAVATATDVGANAAAMAAAMAAARANGYKRAVLRTERFTFSAAPSTGDNAGWVYVKNEFQDYIGKISPDGKFVGRQKDAQVTAALVEVCKNPMAAAIAYGRKTGNCSCCGRELTDKRSVAAGIGPICAEKFGFAI